MAQRRMTVRQLHGPVLIRLSQQLMIRELLPASVRVQPISLQPGMVFSPNRSRSKSHRNGCICNDTMGRQRRTDRSSDQVDIQLLSNGFEYDSITLGTDTEWRHVWVLLDSQDEDGLPITYDVVAAAPIGYTAEVQGSASEGFTVVYRPAK